MKAPSRAGACLLQLGGGFLLWSSCFVALYALLSLGCAGDWGAGTRPVLLAAWAVHLAAIAALLAWQRGAARHALPPPLHAVAITASVVALLATVWIGWPVLALPPCAGGELALP